jgi:ferredoxin-NADP reductase
VEDSAPNPLQRWTARVLETRALSATGFELTFERGPLHFRAGQLAVVHGRAMLEERSYTICSGESDPVLQIVYRLIPDGRLTPWLHSLRPGDAVELSAPYGEFTLRDPTRPLVFIATGTGIAPARAFHRTYPDLNLTIVHGVRTAADLFYREELDRRSYYPCVSGETGIGFPGRVTAFCAGQGFPAHAHYYLCGANAMFYDMRDLLTARGVPPGHLFTEAYYYDADDA